MVWLELLTVLGAIFLGARVGGAGLGTMAALGLLVLIFVFGLPPSSPPGTVLAIVVAVVTAASAMEAAGGMDVLVALADRALRANPKLITFVAPLVAYAFTFCTGTGHVAYSILPVIAEVSRKAGVRPERPMSISVIASQQAITASPLAAATAGLLALLDPHGVTLTKILMVCIPSTLMGVIAGSLAVWRRGPELGDDPVYKTAIAAGDVESAATIKRLEGPAARRAKWSVAIFLAAAMAIVAFGMFPLLRPTYTAGGTTPAVSFEKIQESLGLSPTDADPSQIVSLDQIDQAFRDIAAEKAENITSLNMAAIIQVLMYAAAALMMLFCGAKPDSAVKSKVAVAGVVAVVSILGLGWMGNCFFEGNRDAIVAGLSETVQARPWLFAVALFALSVLLFSQASTVAALMPVGIALGLPAATLVAYFPAVNGYFFLPTYGTIVAAVAFDRTGTTRIGKYVLNHSFMLPGLVATVVAIVSGMAIAKMVM